MYLIFKDYGKIGKLSIPSKRDAKGRRFRFIRFVNVHEEKVFAIKLDNIFTEKRKIRANPPSFHRGVTLRDSSRDILRNVNTVEGMKATVDQILNSSNSQVKEVVGKDFRGGQ